MSEREIDRETGWLGPIYEWTSSLHLPLGSLFILSPVSGGGRRDHAVPPFSRGCGLVRHHKHVCGILNMDLLSTSAVPGSLQGIGDTAANPTNKGPCPQGAHSIRGRVTVKKSIRPDQDRGWGLEQHFLRTHVKIRGGVGGAPLRTWFCHYLLFLLQLNSFPSNCPPSPIASFSFQTCPVFQEQQHLFLPLLSFKLLADAPQTVQPHHI